MRQTSCILSHFRFMRQIWLHCVAYWAHATNLDALCRVLGSCDKFRCSASHIELM
jgi:hypothetical protein